MKILTQMVDQFQARHQRLPEQILVDPVALVVLGYRRSVAPKWKGISVKCRELTRPRKKAEAPNTLAVIAHGGQLRSFDLKL